MRIKQFLLIIIAMFTIGNCIFNCGCVPQEGRVIPSPIKPTILVEQSETNANNFIIVKFLNHDRESDAHYRVDHWNSTHVELNTIEKIRDYKEQVVFLLKQLEDAEAKMTIHEAPVQ